MQLKTRGRIDQILKNHAKQQLDNVLSIADRRTTENVQLRRFVDLMQTVVRPKMVEFSDHLTANGIFCSVTTNDPYHAYVGHTMRSSGLTLRVYLNAKMEDPLVYVPHFMVRWDDVNNVVKAYRSNATRAKGGDSLLDGTYELHEITSDMIEGHLLSFTQWIL